ncbi:hypothetical protein [Aneurinibacillus tyrosinisolvens]|uniref:hypothetical protein n=1 Tax=Aneurinibacillus tyrosinisolvens TaxID=1443435 RepID=UPI00063F9CB4|nr:hypothetical protein [Aneurinibacillus tyrosinisolvens]
MNQKIDKVATLLMYTGPSASEIISAAINNGHEYQVKLTNKLKIVTVHSTIAYNLAVSDVYTYDTDSKLTKQTLIINGKEKIVFDKYDEATEMLLSLEKKQQLIS